MSDRFCLLFCFLLAALTGGCGPRALQTGRTLPVSLPPPVFVSGTAASGIDFALHSNHSPLTILETLGHGVALADFDGDGLLDVVLVGPNKVRLYRNLGQYRFQDVTASSGLAQEGFWQGVAAGDIDNDGKPDLYVCGYNCSALYHDEGGGRFRDITRAAGLLSRPARGGIGDWRASTGFADLDNDGKLDLYVCRYVAFGPHTPQFCDSGGQQTACSPEIYEPQRGLLYHNTGNSRFEDVTASAGLNKASGNGLGVAFGDYNGDGFTDIALANDEKPGDLFENKGGLRFIDRSQESGTALSASGHNHAGMGLDWMDYDADGKPDLFVTTFQNEAKSLYQNVGGGQFTDTGTRAGLTGTLDTLVSFGCKFFDYDNDGWPDLIVASGHVNDNTAHLNGGTQYPQPLLLFHNRGGTFESATSFLDAEARKPLVGRGVAVGDLTNSGHLDVAVSNMEGSPLVLQNKSHDGNHWITLRLIGTRSNRDGFGARVGVQAGGRQQVRDATNGGSFLSASDPRLHFGLGTASSVEAVTIRWPDGTQQVARNLQANRFYDITEGGSVAAR